MCELKYFSYQNEKLLYPCFVLYASLTNHRTLLKHIKHDIILKRALPSVASVPRVTCVACILNRNIELSYEVALTRLPLEVMACE